MSRDVIWPERPGETADEKRLRLAINTHGAALLAALDGAIRLRNAGPSAAKARHRARGHLEDFAGAAMIALAHDIGSPHDRQ